MDIAKLIKDIRSRAGAVSGVCEVGEVGECARGSRGMEREEEAVGIWGYVLADAGGEPEHGGDLQFGGV